MIEILFDKVANVNEVTVFLGALIFSVVFYSFLKNINAKKYNLPPGPRGLPFLGYLPYLLGKDPHLLLIDLSKKYGKVFSLYCGPKLCIVCNDWPSAEEGLTQSEVLSKPEGIFDAVPNGLGHGGSSGREWSEQRKFSVKAMKNIGLGAAKWDALLQEEVDEVLKKIHERKDQPVDINKLFSPTFTNNIMTLLFGNRLQTDDPANMYVNNALNEIALAIPFFSPNNFLPGLCSILAKLGLYGSKEAGRTIMDFSKFMERYINDHLEKNKDIDRESYVRQYYEEMKQQKNRPDSVFTEKSLYGNVQGLIFGGTDTTKTGLAWLLIAMAEYPEIQRKIQNELDSVISRDGFLPWDQRGKVPYTNAAVIEVLRWKTIVPINSLRMTTADIKIQGYDVPKGSIVIVNQWALHNDTKYWSEPEKFKPENFLIDDGKQINPKPESYIPFSVGRRNCPGKLIALMEIFHYFSKIMQNFNVLPPEEGLHYKTALGITYTALDVKLRFIPRTS